MNMKKYNFKPESTKETNEGMTAAILYFQCFCSNFSVFSKLVYFVDPQLPKSYKHWFLGNPFSST